MVIGTSNNYQDTEQDYQIPSLVQLATTGLHEYIETDTCNKSSRILVSDVMGAYSVIL
jgi:hypothetical protein